MIKHKGRIVEVYAGIGGFKRVIQGITKDKQPFYDSHLGLPIFGTLAGSNGSYLLSDDTYPVLYAKVSVYDFNKAIKIDIRNLVLNHYGWERITENRISQLIEKLKGKKVTVIENMNSYQIENIESFM